MRNDYLTKGGTNEVLLSECFWNDTEWIRIELGNLSSFNDWLLIDIRGTLGNLVQNGSIRSEKPFKK